MFFCFGFWGIFCIYVGFFSYKDHITTGDGLGRQVKLQQMSFVQQYLYNSICMIKCVCNSCFFMKPDMSENTFFFFFQPIENNPLSRLWIQSKQINFPAASTQQLCVRKKGPSSVFRMVCGLPQIAGDTEKHCLGVSFTAVYFPVHAVFGPSGDAWIQLWN